MTSNRKMIILDSPIQAIEFLFQRWQELASDAIATRGRFITALSGGRTPVMFYNKLGEFEDLDTWMKTHVFLVDERFVPLDHSASNFGMIRRNLIPMQMAPAANYHPIATDCENVNVAAEAYKDLLLRFFAFTHSNLPSFDFCLLGMGEDGHTASLFPQTQGIDDPNRWTIPVSENHLKQERISLTLSILNQARFTAVLVLGANKAGIVKAVMEENYDCPAARLDSKEGELLFILDQAAAGRLTQTPNEQMKGE